MRQMRQHVFGRVGARKRAAVIAGPLLAVLAALVLAAPASASLRGDLQRFANCPYNNLEVVNCVYGVTESGEFVIGNSAVPITKPVVIQGGLLPLGVIAPATNGETLSKTALPVPGGLVGIELPGNFTEVTATAELAGQGEISTSVHLPLKVKLGNLALGESCYLGSNAEPLTLNLVYGTTNPPPPNKPISGELKVSTRDGGHILVLGGTLVDNAFAAPGANGCTLLPLVGDLAVNIKEGLPAAAGKNTAIMTGANEEASAALVRNTLPLPDIGRCVKVEGVAEGKKLVYHGAWANSSCTLENTERLGHYEWVPGAGPKPGFTTAGTAVKLSTAAGAGMTCSASSGSGRYTGAKSATVALTLTGCHIGPTTKPTSCQSAGAGEGEVKAAALNGGLDFIKEGEEPAVPSVGLDLAPSSGTTVLAFECGGRETTVSGSVIVPVTAVDHMATSLKLKATGSAGKQSPEAFEEGSKDVLTFSPSGGSSEPAGLTTAVTATNEEAVEIKAIP